MPTVFGIGSTAPKMSLLIVDSIGKYLQPQMSFLKEISNISSKEAEIFGLIRIFFISGPAEGVLRMRPSLDLYL